MDLNKLVARAKAMLLSPKTEWPVVATEPATVADLYKGYIIPLAAIPAIFGLIGARPFGIGLSVAMMALGFVISLAMVYLVGLVIDVLAPSFGGQKNTIQAFKTAAFAYTASWIAGVGQIVPWLGLLIMIVGGAYSIYLLYLGLPHTMKAPQEKAGGYTAVVVIITIILGILSGIVIGSVVGAGGMMRGATFSSPDRDTTYDEDSSLGKLEKWSKEVEAASKKLEQAQESGDQAAQEEALKAMMGAAFSGGQKVESLAPDRLKAFVPKELAGLARSSLAAERNSAMGIQVSQANATYSDDSGRELRLEITDAGTAKGLLGLASWAGMEGEREENGRTEKTFREDGRLIHEEWDSNDSRGEYSVVVGDRFTVKLEGEAGSLRELRKAVESLDLDGLAELRTEGVKN